MYKLHYTVNNENRVTCYNSYERLHKNLLNLFKKYSYNMEYEIEYIG